MTTITVNVNPAPYKVVIEHGLLTEAGLHLRKLLPERERLFVVAAAPVERRWGKMLKHSLAAANFDARFLDMPEGEPRKRLATVEQLAEKLTSYGADRNITLIAFGGGIAGDVTGLLASLYMRGVGFVQIPTTVLAQVDAAIGGKTGVNLRTGKNLLGTFHQPRAVLVDPRVLTTLSDREFSAGLYESLKCGVIGKPGLFDIIERTPLKQLRQDAIVLQTVIAESVALKAEVVSSDEKEQGLRRVLNFGHTIGHALEAATRYRALLHGEAVAWGMIAATNIAHQLGLLPATDAERITKAVRSLAPLPRIKVKTTNILSLLQTDKKTSNGVVHFVLPTAIGKVEVIKDVPGKIIANSIETLFV